MMAVVNWQDAGITASPANHGERRVATERRRQDVGIEAEQPSDRIGGRPVYGAIALRVDLGNGVIDVVPVGKGTGYSGQADRLPTCHAPGRSANFIRWNDSHDRRATTGDDDPLAAADSLDQLREPPPRAVMSSCQVTGSAASLGAGWRAPADTVRLSAEISASADALAMFGWVPAPKRCVPSSRTTWM